MPSENVRPQGANWLIPYLTAADADASLSFYEQAFGCEWGFAMAGQNGRPVHASMDYQGATTIVFGPEGIGDSATMRTPANSGRICTSTARTLTR